jgi:HSP20 family protein
MALVPIHISRRGCGPLAGLHRDVDDMLGNFFEGWERPFFDRKLFPAIDVAEDENAVVVNAEVPGCKADDIDISVHGNTLTISGEKKQQAEKKEKGYYHVERSYGNFRREFTLPAEVQTQKIEAVCRDGVLTVTLPKAEEAKAVKVKVKEQ